MAEGTGVQLIYEYSEGTYANRGLVLKAEEAWSERAVAHAYHQTASMSYFAMDATAADHMARHGAMNSRFQGLYYLPWLILDIDGKGAIDTVLHEAKGIVRYLLDTHNVPENAIQIWHSGKKGFHIYIAGSLFGMEPSNNLPADVKATVEKHFAHPLVDLVPINRAGLIRYPYSIHPDTGRRKAPISLTRLFSLNEEDVIDLLFYEPVRPNAALLRPVKTDPILAHLVERGWHHRGDGASTEVSFAKHDPTRMVTCMQRLLARGPLSGRRHQDILRLASWLWRSGIPEEAARRVLEPWLEDRELQRMIESSYVKGYSYSCSDKVMSEFCDPTCVFHKQKDYSMNIKSGDSLLGSVRQHIELVRQGQGIPVAQLYGGSEEYMVYPTELVIVAADTGIGKSLFVQDLVSKVGRKTLYLNLEMPEYLVVRRFLQNRFGITKTEISRRFVEEETEGFAEVLEPIMMVSAAPTVDAIEQSVVRFKPEIVVVDTTDGISVPEAGNSDMWHMKVVVDGLRQIAQKYHVTVIAIHHLSKSGSRAINGTGMEKKRSMSLDDLTGRRDNVTKMDHVWGIEGDRRSSERILRSMKERDNGGFELRLVFDFERMSVRPASYAVPEGWAV